MGRRYEPQRAFGKELREIREELGLSQRDVADEAGVYSSSLSRMENGHWNPSLSKIAAVCEALGVPLSELAKRVERIERDGHGDD